MIKSQYRTARGLLTESNTYEILINKELLYPLTFYRIIMFKKLSLSLTFAALSIASSVQCSDGKEATKTTTSRIDHIKQQEGSVVLGIKKTMIVSEKAIPHMKAVLGDQYEPLASAVTIVVNTIITSEEFSDSLDKVTNYQVTCIIDKGMHFDDISYNPQDYSIDQKIDDELTKAFPSLDQQTEQLFNIFYVTVANYRGGKLLLEKLALKKAALQQELLALEASNHDITE